MSRYIYNGVVKDGNGRVIQSATISVYEAGTTTVASVYAAESGGAAVNSVLSDSSDGSFLFWVDDDDYVVTQRFKIVISKTNFRSKTFDYIYILRDDVDIPAVSGNNKFLKTNAGGTAYELDDLDISLDTTPVLGGDLDVNGKSLGDGTLEILSFEETASAVNEITLKNAATGNAPEIKPTGDDTNISLKFSSKGTGGIDIFDQGQFSKGADVVSAAALPILTDGNSFDVTGTATITSINTTGKVGTWIILQFDAALTLTHHATDLILPGGVNIPTAAGDIAFCYEYASGDYRVFYQKASGLPVVEQASLSIGTPTVTTSGTTIDFTGIPSGTKRITMNFTGFSTDGTSGLLIQLGDAGGFETSGYAGSGGVEGSAGTNMSAGFIIDESAAAANVTYGRIVLELQNATSFTWVENSRLVSTAANPTPRASSGSKSLTGELTQIRLTTINGTDAFDAGEVNITYE